jgi:hypothetical protein
LEFQRQQREKQLKVLKKKKIKAELAYAHKTEPMLDFSISDEKMEKWALSHVKEFNKRNK